MQVISVRQAYTYKFSRQAETSGVQVHSQGLCAHVGRISPGCYWCFTPMEYSWGVQFGSDVGLPNACNLNCAYCFMHGKQKVSSRPEDLIPPNWKLPPQFKESLLLRLIAAKDGLKEGDIPSMAFAGDGAEPLLYMPVIREYMRFYKDEVEKITSVEPWYKIYTNGVLADENTLLELKDLGFTEVRFHLGATNFSQKVYDHLKHAVRHLPVVTVETPSWPPHRQRLFEMLPRIQDIGAQHLNLIEVAITSFNYEAIATLLPEAEIYHSGMGLLLYDTGLVYDLMEEVAGKGYSYSVLDCNGFVKKMRDERTFDRYYRQALRKIQFGSDWPEMGVVSWKQPDEKRKDR
jgi:pyruvate formate-lyase activating enzyme-like uncharacterized protein